MSDGNPGMGDDFGERKLQVACSCDSSTCNFATLQLSDSSTCNSAILQRATCNVQLCDSSTCNLHLSDSGQQASAIAAFA